MLGIYYSVIMPLSNTLHIASDRISQATDFIGRIPGMVASSTTGGIYAEMDIIRNFDALKEYLTMFTQSDLDKIDSFTQGFHFLGLDLLATPQGAGFFSFLWVIPVLSLVTSFGFQFYMSHSQKQTTGQTQPGCMKVMMYVFPLISVYWAFIMPSAVGLYWIISSVTSFIQSLVTNKYFSVNHMTAWQRPSGPSPWSWQRPMCARCPPRPKRKLRKGWRPRPSRQSRKRAAAKSRAPRKRRAARAALETPVPIWARKSEPKGRKTS